MNTAPPWLEPLLREILRSEGWPNFTDDPSDRGGPTKGGITLATLREWRRRPVTVAELRDLSEPEARAIYTHRFVIRPRFHEIVDDLLRWQVVDAGVLSGPPRAAQWLQEAAGVTVDGIVGHVTLTRVNGLVPHRLALNFAARRIRFLGRILSDQASQHRGDPDSVYALGWLARAVKFVDLEAAR